MRICDKISYESVIKGLMTAGAVLCIGYLGKLRLIGFVFFLINGYYFKLKLLKSIVRGDYVK